MPPDEQLRQLTLKILSAKRAIDSYRLAGLPVPVEAIDRLSALEAALAQRKAELEPPVQP